MTSVQQGNIQRLTGRHSKTILVQLDAETLHCLHGLVAEGHLHGDHVVAQTPSTRYFKPLPFLCSQPHLFCGNISSVGAASHAKYVSKQAVGVLAPCSRRTTCQQLSKATSKKVRSRSCFCSFRLPWVEIHVKKISDQTSRLPGSRDDGGPM